MFLGVDRAVLPEHEPHLLAVERDVLLVRDRLLAVRPAVQEVLEDLALDRGLLHHPARMDRLHLLVEDLLRVDHDERPSLAEPVAAGQPHWNVLETFLADRVPDRLRDGEASAAALAGPTADGDVAVNRLVGLREPPPGLFQFLGGPDQWISSD
jgi:hypothetical protein